MERPCLRRERAAPDRRRKYEHEGFEDGGFLQSADEMSFIGRRPQARSVRITRSWAGAFRAVTITMRTGWCRPAS